MSTNQIIRQRHIWTAAVPTRPPRHKPHPRIANRHIVAAPEDRPNSHQRGYNRAWRKYREGFLRRNPLCVHCQERGVVTPANEVDHIVPHRGDSQKFWDYDNHQSLCKQDHSRKTMSESMQRRRK